MSPDRRTDGRTDGRTDTPTDYSSQSQSLLYSPLRDTENKKIRALLSLVNGTLDTVNIIIIL